MKQREYKKLIKTAHHEAGHAVAAFVMRKRFKEVSIIPDEGSLGRLSGRRWQSKLNPEYDEGARLRYQIESAIIVSLAGCVAEAKLTGRFNHKGASADYHWAVDCASRVTGSNEETGAYVSWLLERTKNILSRPANEAAIEKLAIELMQQSSIKYLTVRKIIKKAYEETFQAHRERINQSCRAERPQDERF